MASTTKFPQKALITFGKPDAHKNIHIGHLSGGMINADIFARFMANRIGKENVLLLSGTECYGTSVIEGFYNARQFETIEDYIGHMHNRQFETIKKYGIKMDEFVCTATDKNFQIIHTKMCQKFVDILMKHGRIESKTEYIFYDDKLKQFLNYRQVQCECPFCKSKGNATKCDNGHVYKIQDAQNPISLLSYSIPMLMEKQNYFLYLEEDRDELKELDSQKYADLFKYIKEFFMLPTLWVDKKYENELMRVIGEFTDNNQINIVSSKKSIKIEFNDIDKCTEVKEKLRLFKIPSSSSKYLDRIRLTTDSSQGVEVSIEEEKKRIWVWIESLIAPISYTIYSLLKSGKDINDLKKWWNNEDARVYHFMAEDNKYFYMIIEMFLLLHWNKEFSEKINYPEFVITPMRVLFNGANTGVFPLGDELLERYGASEIRLAVASMGKRNSSFNPAKMLDTERKEDDITLKYRDLMRKVNRLAQKCSVNDVEFVEVGICERAECFGKYEDLMLKQDFHNALNFIYEQINILSKKENIIYDFKMLLVMLYPFLPVEIEKIYNRFYEDKEIIEGYDPKKRGIKLLKQQKVIDIADKTR